MNSFFKTLGQDIKINSKSLFYNKNVRTNTKNTIFTIIFIVVALLISFIIISSVSSNSIGILFQALFSPNNFSLEFYAKDVVVYMSILGVGGLSFLFAYKSGIFNIGISGQMLAGALAVIGLSEHLKSINSPILNSTGGFGVVLAIIVAGLAGALVALTSGVLKNLFNINEVVSAIMLNWIIFYLTKALILKSDAIFAGSVSGYSVEIHPALSLFDTAAYSGYVGSIIIFIVFAVAIWLLFKFTSYGKKIIAIGKSQSAGVYSGYSTRVLQLSSFVISGAIAGVLALIVYTAVKPTANLNMITMTSVPAEGFDGIAIAMVSFSNPIVVIPIAYFFGLIKMLDSSLGMSGASSMTLSTVMYGVAIFVIIYRVKPIAALRKFLKKKDDFNSLSIEQKYNDLSIFGRILRFNSKIKSAFVKDKKINKVESINSLNNDQILKKAKYKYLINNSYDDYLDYQNSISKIFAERKVTLFLAKQNIVNSVISNKKQSFNSFFANKKRISKLYGEEKYLVNSEIINKLERTKVKYADIKKEHINEKVLLVQNSNVVTQGAN